MPKIGFALTTVRQVFRSAQWAATLLGMALCGTLAFAEPALEGYAMEQVKSVRDEVFAKSATEIAKQLLAQAADQRSYANYLLTAAKEMDERGARAAVFAATVSSQQLKDAAAKLSSSSNQLYNNAQAASLMAHIDGQRANRVAAFAKSVPYIAVALQTAWDSAVLFRESSQLQARYPSLPLKATKLEYVDTVFSAAVGLIPYVGQIVAALAPEQTGWEEFDLMPRDASHARAWVSKMEARAAAYRGDQRSLAGWRTGTLTIPPGLLQYLKVCQQINNAETPGLANLAWVNDWSIEPGQPNATGAYPNARSVWKGASKLSVRLLAPMATHWDALVPFSVKATATLPNKGVSLQVLGAAGQPLVSLGMSQQTIIGPGAEQWSTEISVGTQFARLPDGVYSLRAVAVGMDNNGVVSALEPLTIKRSAAPTTSIRLLNATAVAQVGGALIVRAEAVAADGLVPSLLVRDQDGRVVLAAPFNLKVSTITGAEQWQFQDKLPVAVPGTYSLVARMATPGAKFVESAPLPLRVDAAASQPSPAPSAPAAAPLAVVTRVEAQGRLIVNSPGTLLFHGQNFSANVAVTLAHCENGKTALVSPVLIRHDCVPREAGPQMAGWKPNGLTATVNSLSTVDVANPIAMVAAAGTLAAKVDAFVATWAGRPVDVDKSYGYQCVDLMHQYAKDVLGKDGDFARGNAYSIFVNTNSTRLKKTINTPAAVPTKGDVIFWKPSVANGQAGHVAIFLSGDDKSFVSFDQNFCANSGSGTGSCAPRQVSHNYDGVAGWISTSLGTTSVPAVITGMQPQGPLMVNSPATLNFQGQHLTTDVRVTLTNCDGGPTQLINDTQIRHQCTPRMAGAQTVGWKASAADANVRALGTVQVAAAVAPPVSLPLITGMQPQGPLMVNAPATLNFQGQHLTTDVRVTLTNCDGGQTQLINDTQIRHQCTPHMAGAQTVGWKASAAEANVRALGTVQVAAAAVDVRITGLSVNPPSVPAGQAMNFSAALSTTQGVARVDLVFPDVGVTEPMQPSGPNTFSRQRQMTQAGANRQYQMKVTLTNGQSVTQTGSYSVTAQSQPIVPPPPIKTVIGPAPSCNAVAPTQGFVCGADGKRYLNTCTLRVHGIAPNHAGGC